MNSPIVAKYLDRGFKRRKFKNILMCFLLVLAAIAAVAPLLSVFTYIVSQGLPALHADFFTQLPKPVGEVGGGMANAILGTVTLVILASACGVPWGMLIGVYLSEYGGSARKLAMAIRFSVDLLASIPSIVIGLFVYAMLVMPMKRFSAYAGALALGILMIPTIARTTEELLKMVPAHMREAGLALGLPRWKVIVFIVVRGSRSAIMTGIMLAVSRVAGETAPLLFTSFNNRFWQKSLDQPISSLPVQIYTYAISPYDDWHRQAWAGALMLVLLVFLLNVMTKAFLSPAERSRE